MRAKLITLALTLSIPFAAHATTYDAVSSFSTSGPAAPFAYGTYNELSNVFTAFTYVAQQGNAAASDVGYTYFGNFPVVGYVTGSTAGDTFYVPPSELWLHPGPDPNGDNDAAVQFTAPTSGNYLLSFEFTARNQTLGGGNGVNVSVIEGGNVYYTDTLLGQLAINDSTGTLTGPGFLTAGEQVDFVVNNNGNYGADSTGLSATFTTTPEPSSLMLLGTGIAGLAGVARRKLRK